MQYTENYNLYKPVYGEPADVADLNHNADEIDGLIHDNRTMIAPTFDPDEPYSVGDPVEYQGGCYVFIADKAAGVWDASKVRRTTAAEIGGGGASALEDLTDVDLTTPAGGEVLMYDSASGKWENATLPTPTVPDELNDMSDVDITTPADGEVLVYDATSGKWVNAEIETATSLEELTDTDITTPDDGDILVYDETDEVWKNQPQAVAAKTVSGNPIEITDAASAPLVKCVTQITGSQDLHGYDKPWVGGAGKNKYNYETRVDDYYIRNDGEIRAATGSCYSALIPASGTVTLSGHTVDGGIKRIIEYDANGDFLRLGNYVETTANTDYSVSVTVGENTVAVRISLLMTDTNVQLESGSTATSYAPYSNICPITAYTEGEIEVVGDNLFNKSTAIDNKYMDSEGSLKNRDGSVVSALEKIDAVEGKAIYFGVLGQTEVSNCNCRYGLYNSNSELIRTSSFTTSGNSMTGTTITNSDIAAGVEYARLSIYTSNKKNNAVISYKNMTSYKEYNGTTHTTSWTQSIYRGNVDLIGSGSPSVKGDILLAVFDGGSDEDWVPNDAYPSQFAIRVNAYGIKLVDSAYVEFAISNMYVNNYVSASQRGNGEMSIYNGTWSGSSGVWMVVRDDRFTTVADFKAAIATTPIELAYKKATPTTTPVTPTNLPIRTLSGYNHVESSTGDIEIEYITKPYEPLIEATDISIEDHGKTIESIITENLEPRMVASRNYTIGELIISGDKAYRATANIASGATLTVGTNVESTTIEEEIGRSGHVYSTSEQVVGTWIDGSTLYQKTLSFSAPQNSDWVSYTHGISGIQQIVSAECYLSINTGEVYPIPQFRSAVNYISISASPTSIDYINTWIADTLNPAITVILQYTKV